MKKCMNCDMLVGGDPKICPLCHGPLTGEASPNKWPTPKKLRRNTHLYKLQLFVVLVTVVVFLFVDFLFRNPANHEIYVSIPITVWALSFEVVLKHALHWVSVPAKLLNLSCVLIALLLIFTGWYLGFLTVCLKQILPIIVSVCLIINFILCLLDKYNFVLPYLMGNIVVGVVPYIFQFILKGRGYASIAWTVCVLISIITFLGIAIFQGANMKEELSKRFHI